MASNPAAQAVETARTSAAVQGSPDHSQAVPAEESQRIAAEEFDNALAGFDSCGHEPDLHE